MKGEKDIKIKTINKKTKYTKSKVKAFKPDYSLKKLLKKLKKKKLIKIISYVLKMNIDTNSKVEFLETQKFDATGKKKYLESDFVIKIIQNKDKEEFIIPIEFQSTLNNNMNYRVIMYCANNIVEEKGKYIIPNAVVIYTVLGKFREGEEKVEFLKKYIENDKIQYTKIKLKYRYINLLEIPFKDFKGSIIEVFKVIYLYKYLKKISYILKEDFENILEECKVYIESLKNEEKKIVYDIFCDILIDLKYKCEKLNIKALKNNKEVKYEKEVEAMNKIWMSYSEKLEYDAEKRGKRLGKKLGKNEGKIEGKIEAIEQMALKMLENNSDIAYIQNITNLSIKKINELKSRLITV